MVSKGIVPTVVVGKKEQGTIWTAYDKGVHVGKFGAVRDGDRLNLNLVGQRMHTSRGNRLNGKHPLVEHQSPLRRPFDEGLHGRRDVQAETRRVESLASKQAETVDVTEMSVSEENRPEGRVAPRAELIAKSTGGFNEVPLSLLVDDAQAHRVANIFRAEVGAARSLATGLRSPSVLGDSKQGNRRHDHDHGKDEHEPFHAKVSNHTTKPVGLRDQRASTVKS